MELVVARLIAVANSIAVLAAAVVVVVPIAVGKGYFETAAAANILVETHILVMLGLESVEHFVVVVAHFGRNWDSR